MMSRLLVSLALALPSFAALATPDEKTLANGLRVIVQEDRRAPTAVHMVWYRAGSMDEVDGTSGVAHVLEGSVRRSGNRIRITAQLVNTEDGFPLWSADSIEK